MKQNAALVLGLGELRPGMRGTILSTEGPTPLHRRLLEMGLLEGSQVELLHEAPFGGDPIAVRVRGTVLAIRRSEANYVRVELEAEGR